MWILWYPDPCLFSLFRDYGQDYLLYLYYKEFFIDLP
jgi:hypothetical protein